MEWRERAFRALRHAWRIVSRVVIVYYVAGAVIEGLTNFRVLHSPQLWDAFHQDWVPIVLLAVFVVEWGVSRLARRALRQ